MGLNFTNIWYANDKEAPLAELDYIPTMVNLFIDLVRQDNEAYHIPLQAKKTKEYLILPLDDVEQHDHYEASLYMQPFIKASTRLAQMVPSMNDPPPTDTNES